MPIASNVTLEPGVTIHHPDLGYGPGDFPHSERAAAEVLSLPMFPELAAEQVQQAAAAVRAAAADQQNAATTQA